MHLRLLLCPICLSRSVCLYVCLDVSFCFSRSSVPPSGLHLRRCPRTPPISPPDKKTEDFLLLLSLVLSLSRVPASVLEACTAPPRSAFWSCYDGEFDACHPRAREECFQQEEEKDNNFPTGIRSGSRGRGRNVKMAKQRPQVEGGGHPVGGGSRTLLV